MKYPLRPAVVLLTPLAVFVALIADPVADTRGAGTTVTVPTQTATTQTTNTDGTITLSTDFGIAGTQASTAASQVLTESGLSAIADTVLNKTFAGRDYSWAAGGNTFACSALPAGFGSQIWTTSGAIIASTDGTMNANPAPNGGVANPQRWVCAVAEPTANAGKVASAGEIVAVHNTADFVNFALVGQYTENGVLLFDGTCRMVDITGAGDFASYLVLANHSSETAYVTPSGSSTTYTVASGATQFVFAGFIGARVQEVVGSYVVTFVPASGTTTHSVVVTGNQWALTIY
jgi:hypothetical protein